jgi:hypothetical protein
MCTIHGGPRHRVRQAVIALVGGHTLDEFDCPGNATCRFSHHDLAGRHDSQKRRR